MSATWFATLGREHAGCVYGCGMTKPFRFAVQGRSFDDHDALVAAARQAEALGYDELFSFDHVGSVDPFVPLVVAAESHDHVCASGRWC